MNAVEVRNVSKYYRLTDSPWSRLRNILSPAPPQTESQFGSRRAVRNLCALRDVSFCVADGEVLGIIGSNGSGKSTLLQIVAGILQPTTGSVQLNGRCSTLLELGSGFAPEFTGRQNVMLNATILGLSREEIEEKFDAIHRFSGIGDFIDQPIRTYSTGMVLRLAFAVAAHSDPRILIVDEALAVGDVAFRQRCMRRIHELRAAGVTILFVSHDTGDVKSLCERCLWLDRGVVRGLGEADEIVAQYLATTVAGHKTPSSSFAPSSFAPSSPTSSLPSPGVPSTGAPGLEDPPGLRPAPTLLAALPPGTHRFGNEAAEVIGFQFFAPADPQPRNSPEDASRFLQIRVRANSPVVAPILGFLVRNKKGETIFGSNSARENHPLPALEPGEERTFGFRLTLPRLASGTYSISVGIADGTLNDYKMCDYIEDALTFAVDNGARLVEGYIELACRAVVIHRS